MRKQIFSIVAMALLIPMAQATPVSAAPGSRAERSSIDECDETSCSTSRGVRKQFETPSGNLQTLEHGTGGFSEGSLTQRGRLRYKQLTKKGRVHAQIYHARTDITFEGETCRLREKVILVNGEVRHDKMTEACDDK